MSAADLALELVGYNKEVLGIGVESACMTERLEQRGCTVVEMEHSLQPAVATRPGTGERVMASDLDDSVAWQQFKDESFDAVLLTDVLAGVDDPLAALSRGARKIKPAGVLVAWLPNVAHGDARRALRHGEFRYGRHGLLDSRHVESFTLDAIRTLFRRAGLLVVDTARVIMPLFGSQFGATRDQERPDVLRDLMNDPEIETYEYVLRAVRDNGDWAVAELTGRLHELSDRVHGEKIRTALLRAELRQMDDLAFELKRHQKHIEEQQSAIAEQQQYIDALTGHISGLEHNVEVLTRSLEELHQNYVATDAMYKEMLGRRTVQGTAPVRWAYDKLTRRPEGM